MPIAVRKEEIQRVHAASLFTISKRWRCESFEFIIPCFVTRQRAGCLIRHHPPVPTPLDTARTYYRFATGLRRFLKHSPSFEESRERVRTNVENRERNFLRILEVGVYGNPRSPYLALLKHAGYSIDDVRALVSANGLEGALRMLRNDGVYVTFEEFKGRAPIVRDGVTLNVSDKDFDNPRLVAHYEGQSSGSTGAGTRVAMDFDHMRAVADQANYYFRSMMRNDAPMAVWFPVLPASSGLMAILLLAVLGIPTERWFTPVTSADMKIQRRYRWATSYARGMARLFGFRTPEPEPVAVNDAGVVAEWAGDALRRQGECLIATYTSLAVRVALAAKEKGIDLTGCVFHGTGEPATPGKVRAITSSGASFRSAYGFTEGGLVGLSCGSVPEGTDMHLYEDAWALLQTPVQVPASTLMVDAFCFTGLLATAPKIILNVELDDYGILEERECECPLNEFFPTHVREVYSFRKLTGEGMTLVGSTMLRVLEEVLPATYGGSALDYQLVEEEDESGFTRLTIVVSPSVGPLDDERLIETVLDEISRDSPGADLARAVWRDAGTLRVRRDDPAWSTLGKLLSLRPARRNAGVVPDVKSA